jgi:ABC-type phosphate transport system substrate-binding protein
VQVLSGSCQFRASGIRRIAAENDLREQGPMPTRPLLFPILALGTILASPMDIALAAPPVCALDATSERMPSSLGDPVMQPLMEHLRTLYASQHPGAVNPSRWDFPSDASAIGALMFELADLAPAARSFTPAEIAPYEHQFHGDMIKEPLTVRIGTINGRPAIIAVNRRPDSPLPPRIRDFLDLALSPEGQAAMARVSGFTPMDAATVRAQQAALAGFVAPLDPALSRYRPQAGLIGDIRSIGSDGMKDLMDGWECRFHALQPGVSKGEWWEHLGTLNGYTALLVGQADIAPMGRELWPQERRDWKSIFGADSSPIEILVARGGFNTQQRTTAQAIFVNPTNPLKEISVDQLKRIFGEHPSITRWGQLGLGGEWAERPIHIRMPPRIAPNAMSMQIMVLKGVGWNPTAVEAPIAQTAKALLDDPSALGFGGLEEGDPGLKVLAVAPADGQPAVPLDADSASSGRYPLTRGMYIRLAPGPIQPQVAAFLRFILSKDGQERVRYSGYFPLSAAEASAEMAKLSTGRSPK